ncbi:MAG: glycosyltransferase family 2 protein [Oscillospiraceae bacterium]|nr:glycosyltransferase family 2 protein [Oscillospiraceae bacterium]
MTTISLCMIVKNEEEVLARCLDSVAGLADEIVIVDTGSSDKTKQIAARYTQNLYDFVWTDDFAAARNFSFSKASMAYCMWMDADDVLEPQEREKFLSLKATLDPATDVVMMKYNTAFDEGGKPVFSYYRERWLKNSPALRWVGQVHEVVPPCGKIYYADIALSHKKLRAPDPDRNLKIYQKLLAENQVLEPRQQYYYGRELYYHCAYADAAAALEAFLDMPAGWTENKIEACALCADCCQKLGQEARALQTLFRSFALDVPRAEICCDIGSCFFARQNYRLAAYWYLTATKCERDDTRGGFIRPDCYDYIPFLQLCVCCDKLGDPERARAYNDKAGACKPDSQAYLFNKRYFEKRKPS